VDYATQFQFRTVFGPRVLEDGVSTSGRVLAETLTAILAAAATPGDQFSWEALLARRSFLAPRPQKASVPSQPEPPSLPTVKQPILIKTPDRPSRSPTQIRLSFLERFLPALRKRATENALHRIEAEYEEALRDWEQRVLEVESKNRVAEENYEKRLAARSATPQMEAYQKAAAH
jgi:hypothetical protein